MSDLTLSFRSIPRKIAFAIQNLVNFARFVKQNFEIKAVLSADDDEKKYHLAKDYLDNNEVLTAWKVLLAKQ